MAIKWKQTDYLQLGKAVANFNKKINELNKEERKLYLPEIITYEQTKADIQSRKQLKNVINSLRRFTKEGAEELYTTSAGEQLTKWEIGELQRQQRIAERNLRAEIKELEKPVAGSGYSKAQMRKFAIHANCSKNKKFKNTRTKTR